MLTQLAPVYCRHSPWHCLSMILFAMRLACKQASSRYTHLNQELIPPIVQILKGLLRVDVVHQHTAVCASVESHAQALEPLLPGCVPDLPGTQVHSQMCPSKIAPPCAC